MDMDVDEAGHDVVVVEGEGWMSMAAACRAGSDIDDPAAIDDDGARRDHSVGQDQIRARQDCAHHGDFRLKIADWRFSLKI